MGGLKSAGLPTAGDIGDGDSGALAGGGFARPSAAPTTPGSLGAFRPSPLDRGGILDGLASGSLALSAPVGPGAANRPGDVFRVESVLSGGEFLGRPPGRVFGNDTRDAVKAAQTRLNRDHPVHVGKGPLEVDGLITPVGPTQAATRGLAGQVARARRVAARSEAPKPAPKPASPLAPRGESLEASARRLAAKGPLSPPRTAPKPTLRDRIAAMPGDDFQALERLAQGLRKTTKPGPMAGDIAGAFRADPEAAAAEFSVVREELQKSGTPDQVENLDKAVRAELTPGERARFDDILADNADVGVRRPAERDFLLRPGEEAPPETKEIRPGRDDDPRHNMPLAEKAAEGGQGGRPPTGDPDGREPEEKPGPKLPEPHTGLDEGKGPGKVPFDPHRVRQDQVDNDRAAGLLGGLAGGKGELPPVAKAPDGKTDVNIGGYRLDPRTTRLLQRALTVTPETEKQLRRDIIGPPKKVPGTNVSLPDPTKSPLDAVQKGELARLVGERLQGKGFDKMTPGQQRARVKELLSQMDRRNVKARANAELIVAGIIPSSGVGGNISPRNLKNIMKRLELLLKR